MQASELFDIFEGILTDPSNIFVGISEVPGVAGETNLLGTYTYASGQTEPAISIDNPGKNISRISGLECTIPLLPSQEQGATTSEQTYHLDAIWNVMLVQRSPPPKRSPTLPEAIRRLKTVFSRTWGGHVSFSYLAGSETIGSYPQCRISIYECDLQDEFDLLYALGA